MRSVSATFVGALSLVVLLPFCGGGIDRPSIDEVSSDSVTYQTEDGVRIVAGWFLPPEEAKPPVVILFHEQDGTRAQWNELIPILVKEGYAVLAPDLRGHGESDTIIREGQEQPYGFANPVEALLDVAAALRWLEGRSDVDLTRIGAIGARLGADLAYVSTGASAKVRAAIAITPDPFLPENANYPLLATIPDYAAHDVFIMAGGRRQWEDAVTIGIRISFPKGRRYLDTPDLEGVALVANDDMVKDTLEFFEQRVKSPATTASPAPPTTASPIP